mmetsp:Transcript_26418/g.89098  ORF Transcript_26418/g.89098 Transcript_26418/m.89098 type:complete len:255 (+) Transcript_26418:49-813(+)
MLILDSRCLTTLSTLLAAVPRAPSPAAQLSPEVASTTSAAAPLMPDRLIALTQEFLNTGTGFYSPLRPELMAEDFIFRGGVVGPLSKTDYCRTMRLLGIADAWQLQCNAFGFVIDPADPMCVRFFLRNTGEHVGAWQPWGAVPPIPIQPTPGKTSVVGPTETGRCVFDAEGKVRHFATGLVVGKYEAQQGGGVNTNGLGAVLGLFHTVGLGAVGNLALSKTVRDLSNAAADQFEALKIPKTETNEEDVPRWWRE